MMMNNKSVGASVAIESTGDEMASGYHMVALYSPIDIGPDSEDQLTACSTVGIIRDQRTVADWFQHPLVHRLS